MDTRRTNGDVGTSMGEQEAAFVELEHAVGDVYDNNESGVLKDNKSVVN